VATGQSITWSAQHELVNLVGRSAHLREWHLRASLTCVVVALSLASCSSDVGSAPTTSVLLSRQELRRLETQEYVKCYQEHGWSVSIEGQMVQFDAHGTPADQQQVIIEGCQERASKYAWVAPTTADGWKLEYPFYVATHQCLVEKGFPVAEQVSEAVFVQLRGADPYSGLSAADNARALQECPT